MEHTTEFLIITTNILVFFATVALALVTGADVVKDQNKTIREAIKGLVVVNNRSKGRGKGHNPKPIPGQTELSLVPDDEQGSVA